MRDVVGNPIGGALTGCVSKFPSSEIVVLGVLSSRIAELGDTGKQDAHTGGSLERFLGDNSTG